MNFLITSDNNFKKPLASLLLSIKNNNQQEKNVFYYPYINDIKDSRIDATFLEKYTKANDVIIQFEVPSKCYLPSIGEYRWNYQVWLKLTCLFYLPHKINKLLYIDADCIVDSDLNELYNYELKIPVTGINEMEGNNKHLKRLGVVQDNKYICGGVLLIDPISFVNEFKNVDNLILQYKSIPFVPFFNEQDFLNYYYHDVLTPIYDEKYMFFVKKYKYSRKKHIAIYHYADVNKPWELFDYHYNIILFLKYWKYGIRVFGFFAFLKVVIKTITYPFIVMFKRLFVYRKKDI